ncbi:hypothetical protein NCCP2140_36480 [Pseudoalteromonas sp. NCCP-2140]|uniref:DUF4124 domain-containing protein n=1 Tax=Pseudoalteromonas sp. NCCP-2140 TaxID=2942288 RepID=UPI00203EA5F7|nr:DUF4124 domain-containing protein [Pseudoalteromonas sp. NCCP-2140]GKW54595.1 hypothetical protein NCCP2140_36480 [Pseudoalteromonas sp. NCCP-2140]
MRSTTLLVLIFIAASVYAESEVKKVYSWKDKNGVLVFSDSPRPGATEVKMNTQNLTMPATDTSILNSAPSGTPVKFKVSISSPANEATVRENTGSVYVTARISPRFETGFKVQLLFDGTPHGAPSNSTTFALREVNRGEHTLQAKLYNANNKLVSVSPISTFFMHRASVINRN